MWKPFWVEGQVVDWAPGGESYYIERVQAFSTKCMVDFRNLSTMQLFEDEERPNDVDYTLANLVIRPITDEELVALATHKLLNGA
jgi:hypothetical protein